MQKSKRSSKPAASYNDVGIFTDGSVTMEQSGWGFTAKRDGRTIHEDSGTHRVTSSSLTVEVRYSHVQYSG